jgi:hypothetical protein
MNKELITNAIVSAIELISNELDSLDNEELQQEFELTLTELNLALNEIKRS